MKSYFPKVLLCCTVFFLITIIYTFKINITRDRSAKIKPLKYILLWTSDEKVPFVYMGKGANGFVDRKCPYVNCFVTSNKDLLGDYTKFDVIAFAGPQLSQENHILPERRSTHQKYVFASIESSNYYNLCNSSLNGFFNWTWSYKLDSDVRWGYIVIRDKKNNIIGPKKDMNWLKLEDMHPVTEEFKKKLKTKKKAAAWFVSNCFSESMREKMYHDLQSELSRYRLSMDVYGECGFYECSRDNGELCDKKIADEYYFYLSFENAFSEDYVTEKLLRALNNDAIPIVYGDANYTRFMPDGIYLNSRELGVKKLAAKMNELINNPEQYAQYFRWKNHYSYHMTTEAIETNEYCRFCEILNDEEAMTKATVYWHFTHWWNPSQSCDDKSPSSTIMKEHSTI